jgi:pimeloyl-ACP methyl ester carboxylesterase
MERPVVLVHGAWHGAWAWAWERVLPLLTSAGVECFALDLPGHGADGAPFGDLSSEVACVRETLDELDGDVVLVGHSYGAPSSPRRVSIQRSITWPTLPPSLLTPASRA